MQKSCFSERLREAMNANGMSQADLSRASGVTEATVSRYLSGEIASPIATVLTALASSLDTTPNVLLGYPDCREARRPAANPDCTRALEQVKNIADRAICAANVMRDDMTRPSYSDEYVALAICFGELCGMVRLIKDTAQQAIDVYRLEENKNDKGIDARRRIHH